MRFGKSYRDMEKDASAGDYLRRFKGETKVRFLQEIDEWKGYSEHYTDDGKSYPCPAQDYKDRDKCPGCSSDSDKLQRRSRRAAANVLLVEQQIVLPFKIPITLADDLSRRADRKNEKITERDYTIIVTGTGLETKYEFDPEDAYDIDVSAYAEQLYDIDGILESSYAEIWGDVAEVGEKGEEPLPSEGTEDQEVSEATLRAMPRRQVINLMKENNIDLPEGYEDLDRDELVEHVIKVAS